MSGVLGRFAGETNLLQEIATPHPYGACNEYSYLMEQAELYMQTSSVSVMKVLESSTHNTQVDSTVV